LALYQLRVPFLLSQLASQNRDTIYARESQDIDTFFSRYPTQHAPPALSINEFECRRVSCFSAAWLPSLTTSYTLGGFIYPLAVLAITVILVRVIQRRKPTP
jgi:hypothetical protein